MKRPVRLHLVPDEFYPTQRPVSCYSDCICRIRNSWAL